MKFYFVLVVSIIWFILVSAWMCVLSLFRFGDPNLNHTFSALLAKLIFPLIGIDFEVRGQENIPNRPVVSTANHQSGLDILTFGLVSPDKTIAMAKKEMIWAPFFGFYYLAANNVFVNRSNHKQAMEALNEVFEKMTKKKFSLWMFVEGTRNRAGVGFLPFKKGAFKAAIQTQSPILPYVSSPLNSIASWKNKKIEGGKVIIQILPPIPTEGKTAKDVEALLNETRSKMLAAYEALGREIDSLKEKSRN